MTAAAVEDLDDTPAVEVRDDRGELVESIAAYLPDNCRVSTVDGETVIGGRYVAGWTLDAYVIPRLASGLYFATESTCLTRR